MELLNPSALWLLALLAVLLVLPRLRLPRVRREVANAYMWRPVESPDTPRFLLRLRRHRVMLIQAAVMLLLIAAAARPLLLATARDVVVVVDLSGSMGARQDGHTRLDIARDAVRALVRELPRGSRVRVVAARATASDLGEFGAASSDLRTVLDGLRPGAGAASLDSAVATGRALAGGKPDVYVFTDQPASGDASRWTRVGRTVDNLAVTAFAGRRLPGSPLDGQVIAEVRNFGAARREVPVAIRRGQALVYREIVTIGPHESRTVVHDIGDLSGVYTATIEADDALDVDNQRFTIPGATAPVAVSLVTPGNFFLERALDANRGLDVRRVATPDEAHTPVIVCDGCREIPRNEDGVLMIARARQGAVAAGLRVTDAGHPIMAGVDLDGIEAPIGSGIEIPSNATILARAAGLPAIAAFTRDGRRIVIIQADAARSGLPLEIAFPILIANAIDWLAETNRVPTVVDAGEAVHWKARGDGLVITTPDGRAVRIPADAGAAFTDTETPGVYRVEHGGDSSVFVVNAATASESDLSSPLVPGDAASTPGAPAARRRPIDLFTLLVLAGLLLAAFEWRQYCRERTT
jgi:hypothetical protein